MAQQMESPGNTTIQLRLPLPLADKLKKRATSTNLSVTRILNIAGEHILVKCDDAELLDLDCELRKAQITKRAPRKQNSEPSLPLPAIAQAVG